MQESKSLQRFRSRIEYLEQHMQAIDICIAFALETTKANPNAATTIRGALSKKKTRYDRINQPISESVRVFSFSKSQSFEHSLIALYRHFGEYLRSILEEMYSKDPLVVVGKVTGTNLPFHELVTLGSYEAIVKK